MWEARRVHHVRQVSWVDSSRRKRHNAAFARTGSIVLGAVEDVSAIAVSVIPDSKLKVIGSILEGAAPGGRPTAASIGLRVGNDGGGIEDMVFDSMQVTWVQV